MNTKMLRYVFSMLTIYFSLVTPTVAQDMHATQFYNTPYLINPGLVGQFQGQQRYMAYQRTQWKSITVPYKSFALAGEIRNIPLRKWSRHIPNIHSGIVLETDKAGDSRFRTTALMMQIAVPINCGGWHCTPAVGLGMLNMSIDRTDLYFDSHWNGQVFDPQSPNGETALEDSYTRLQMNTGIAFSKTTTRQDIQMGIGFHNIQKPRQNFIQGAEIKLNTRMAIHGQIKHKIDERWCLEPLILLMFQGPYRTINPGVRVHYDMNTPGIKSIVYAGIIGRASDAGNILAGIKYDQWDIGLSYDINVSDLVPASHGRGGLELTAIYILPMPREIPMYHSCRKWM